MLWGTTGTTLRKAPADATTLGVGSVRLLIGGAVLVLVAWRRVPSFSLRPVRRDRWLVPMLIGVVAVPVYQLSFFAAVQRTGVAVGTMLAIGSGPVFAGLLDLVVRHRRPSRLWALATTLAVCGGALLASGGGNVHVDALGCALALVAGFGYASYASAGSLLIARGVPPAWAMALLFAGGGLLLVPVLLTQPLGWLTSIQGLAVALWLGVVTTAGAYLLFGAALRWLPVSTVTTLSLAEPATAAVLAVVVLGERLPPAGWVGVALIVTGLVLVGRPPRGARLAPVAPTAV
jgi:DME family drug/metabolite transporter